MGLGVSWKKITVCLNLRYKRKNEISSLWGCIGHLVTGNTYRHPCLTAKMAVSLAHISSGRLNLGIGAGWFELEHTSLGLDFKTVRGRLEALEEALKILRGMFAGERVTLRGNHYSVTEAFSHPGPVQAGGPPIMIGGEGRKFLLRLVAEYADMWNAFGSPAHMRELIEVIERHAARAGRDADAIEKTVMLPLCYSDDATLQDMIVGLLAAAFGSAKDDMRSRMIVGGKRISSRTSTGTMRDSTRYLPKVRRIRIATPAPVMVQAEAEWG